MSANVAAMPPFLPGGERLRQLHGHELRRRASAGPAVRSPNDAESGQAEGAAQHRERRDEPRPGDAAVRAASLRIVT